jgi:biotin carboxyl carrier protein
VSARTLSVAHGDRTYRVTVADDGAVSVDDVSVRVTRAPLRGEVVVERGELVQRVFAEAVGDAIWAFHDGRVYELAVDSEENGRRRTTRHQGSLVAPMPAAVVAVLATPGASVKRGDVLMILEAMKMELPVRAPGDGVVKAINCRPGDMVQANASLLEME